MANNRHYTQLRASPRRDRCLAQPGLPLMDGATKACQVRQHEQGRRHQGNMRVTPVPPAIRAWAKPANRLHRESPTHRPKRPGVLLRHRERDCGAIAHPSASTPRALFVAGRACTTQQRWDATQTPQVTQRHDAGSCLSGQVAPASATAGATDVTWAGKRNTNGTGKRASSGHNSPGKNPDRR